MRKVLLKKITNILDIHKDAEYINFVNENEYIDLEKFIEIEKLEAELLSNSGFKFSFEIAKDYQLIISELKKINNHNEFNDILSNHDIPIFFDSTILKSNQQKVKVKTKQKVKTKSNKNDEKNIILEENEEKIIVNNDTFENVREEFLFQKNNLLEKIENWLLEDLKQYKEIMQKAKEREITTGKWNLKIGFDFICGMINDTNIFAPLFFRTIEIQIKDNKIKISSVDDNIEFNEKLWIFIMKELKREITDEIKSFENYNDFKNTIELLLNYELKEITDKDFSSLKESEFKKTFRTIKYSKFYFISLFDTKSGKIKDNFLELMNGKNKDIFSKDMENDNEFYSKEEFRKNALIQINNPLNVYQKYAVRSAMSENTIIYGPPGTGKSEIITSIVANIIMQGKNLIVVSEKSAALDVIKNRLGKLKSFAFYLKDLENEKIIYEQIENVSDQMGSFYNDEYKNKVFNLEDAYNKNDRVIDYNISIKKFREILQESIDFSLKRDSRGNDYREYLLSINMINKFVKENKTGVEKFWEEYRDKFVKLQSPTEFIAKVAEYNWFKNSYNIVDEEIGKYDKMRNDLINFLVENNFVNYSIEDFDEVNNKVQELELFIKEYMLHKDRVFSNELESDPQFLLKNYEIMKRIDVLLEGQTNKTRIITFLFKNIVRHDKFLTKFSTLSENSKWILFERYFSKNEIVVKKGLFSKKMSVEKLKIILSCIREFNDLKTFKTNEYLKNITNFEKEFFSPITIYFQQNKHLLKQNFIDFYNKKIIIFDLRIINQYYKYRVNKIERELINISNYDFEIASKNKIIIERNMPELIKKYLKNNQDFILNMDSALYDIYIEFIKNKLAKSSKEFQDKCNKMIRISRMENKPKINDFITEFLDCLLTIFPIWISKPDLIAHYTDLKESLFNVGIFDEASQMFLEKAYPILYRCEYVIVSGDDKQLKPERLIFNEYNENKEFPKISEIEFNNSESLLDRARVSYWNTYTLKNHYRSLAKELIEFSNLNFYDDKLLFATLNKNDISPLEVVNIEKIPKISSEINKEEATKIISKLKTEEITNTFKKILVICFTKTQKSYIENKIFSESSNGNLSTRVKSGSIVIKDISSVQGDEADLVLISVVFCKSSESFGLITKPRGSNYLNVAITRSKSKIIIFKSISSSDITPEPLNKDLEIFRTWIKYLDGKNKLGNKTVKTNIVTGDYSLSNFKKDIYENITNSKVLNKFKFKQNIKLGSEVADIAIYANDPNDILLLIILDDWKKNISISSFFEDIDREEYLMSRNYKVVRLLETDWLKDQDTIIEYIENLMVDLVPVVNKKKK